ncbi:hypothetical protein AFB00_25655 [Pseudonocardia sp. HH130630-07]|nr:hypothetical protein AFB00_25655 [Pseudonocardia sp. HH130630-07]
MAVALGLTMGLTPGWAAAAQPPPPPEPELPVVIPTPQSMQANGAAIGVPARVGLMLGDGADEATKAVVRSTLEKAGAKEVVEGQRADLTVVVGLHSDPEVAAALTEAGGEPPTGDPRPEGYSLASRAAGAGGTVALAGNDDTGVF